MLAMLAAMVLPVHAEIMKMTDSHTSPNAGQKKTEQSVRRIIRYVLRSRHFLIAMIQMVAIVTKTVDAVVKLIHAIRLLFSSL